MKKTFALVMVMGLLLCFAGLAASEEGSWTGYVSDAACAKNYEKASKDHAACAKGCVSKGGQWALAMKDAHVILDVAKETVEPHAGHMVVVKGTLDKSTNTVKVSSLEMAKQ